MTGLYCFAEKRIKIESLYPEIHRLCADYRTKGEADFSVSITQEDIDFEREISAKNDKQNGKKVAISYTDTYLETLAVYRKIAEIMPQYNTVLFHGSAIAVDGKAYLFTAKSGVGKSTHTRLWRELLGDRAVMVNDDKPLIRITGSGVTVFGTPWDGKHRLSNNIGVPLKAVCLLERAEKNTILAINQSEAVVFLLRQIYRPFDTGAFEKTLDLLDLLTESVKLYRLRCNKQPEAAKIAFEGMKG